MIKVKLKGDFKKVDRFFERVLEFVKLGRMDYYGRLGVNELSAATPVDTGLTAASWKYRIDREDDRVKLVFYNTNIQNGVPVAIVLQYGHATATGGWVEGRDYINPALQPIFDAIRMDIENEVRSL